MSDHDADPMDKAYAQAEAVLDDESARAARRARVLAAVAQATAEAAAPTPPPAWRRGGWLVAASVAGLSVILATQVYSPPSTESPPAPATPAAPAPNVGPTPPPRTAEAPAKAALPEALAPPPRASASSPEPPAPARDAAQVEPPPSPPSPLQAARARPEAAPAVAPAPPPPPAAPPSEQGVSEVVITGSRIESGLKESGRLSSLAAPTGPAARLRDAAARGRTAEVAKLLAKGIPVDEPDGDGETALMKSIEANHPAAAALLRRHGASLDQKNRAGVSARDMATSIGDAELNRALGLEGNAVDPRE